MTKGAADGGPKLELPSPQEWNIAQRPARAGSPVLALLLVAVLAAQIVLVARSFSGEDAKETATRDAVPPSDGVPLRDLAARLQQNNLHEAAARVQREHVATLEDRAARAKAHVALATTLAGAGRHEEAVAELFRAELLGVDSDTQTFINSKVTEWMRKLGRHDEVARELADRSSPGWKPGRGGPGSDAADLEVASIGIEVFRASDLDAAIARDVERQLRGVPGVEGEQRDEYRRRLLAELRAPRRRLQKLQEIVAREVLFREGVERELDRSEAVRAELDAIRQDLVARQVVLDAMEKRIRVSESDLRNFFQAAAERYASPASARVHLAVVADGTRATELVESGTTAEAFAALAKQHDIDAARRASGGLLDEPVAEGGAIPGLGQAPALVAAILSTPPGKPMSAPIEVPGGHAVAFVISKSPRRTPTFEEVRDRVARDYVRNKEAEVQRELIDELFDKHNANVRAEAFLELPEKSPTAGSNGPAQADPPPDSSK